jgi:hypothetical protein
MSKSQIAHASIRILLTSVVFVSAAFAADMPTAANSDKPSNEARQKMAAHTMRWLPVCVLTKAFPSAATRCRGPSRKYMASRAAPMVGTGMHERMKTQ